MNINNDNENKLMSLTKIAIFIIMSVILKPTIEIQRKDRYI